MPEDTARGFETLTTPSDFTVRDLGQSKPLPTLAALEDVDEEQLRAFLQTRGLEIRQIPKEYGVISRVQDVKEKEAPDHTPNAIVAPRLTVRQCGNRQETVPDRRGGTPRVDDQTRVASAGPLAAHHQT